jgi:hypothetical protein
MEGRYSLPDLPAGSYTISADKVGFVTQAFGASRPARPGTRVTLEPGRDRSDLDIRLPRGSVLSGRLYDESGEPIVRVSVRAMRYRYVQGQRRLFPSGYGDTDDRGQFRIFGLEPGTYILSAVARSDVTNISNLAAAQRSTNFASTYYPGVSSVAEAITVSLGLQQEISALDFMLQLVPTVSVSGVVISQGEATSGASVALVPEDPEGASTGPVYGARMLPDGTFRVSSVPPGRYLAVARGATQVGRSGGQATRRASMLMAIQPLTVAGVDVTNLGLVLTEGGTLTGLVVAESGASTGGAVRLPRFRLVAEPAAQFLGAGAIAPGNVMSLSGEAFTLGNVAPIPQYLRVTGLPSDWWVKGIYLDGREVTETPIDVGAGQTVTGLQVVLSDRPTEIAGSVLDADGQPRADVNVVAFDIDEGTWKPRSRRVAGVRPSAEGAFQIRGLPPGDYYVAVGEDLEQGSWYDPVLLVELRANATRVTLAEGEKKKLDFDMSGKDKL